MMFISVEPRATSVDRSVRSAEVMIGIIVPPMPRPITNSDADDQHGTTCRRSTWVSAEHAERR